MVGTIYRFRDADSEIRNFRVYEISTSEMLRAMTMYSVSDKSHPGYRSYMCKLTDIPYTFSATENIGRRKSAGICMNVTSPVAAAPHTHNCNIPLQRLHVCGELSQDRSSMCTPAQL